MTIKPKPAVRPKRAATRRASNLVRAANQTAPKRTRNTILEAALKVFARDGFDGASMPKIAAAARVGHPLIHYHFGSKEDLWREVVEFAFGESLNAMRNVQASASDLDPLDRLRVLIRIFTTLAAHHPEHFRLIVMESRNDTERFAWFYQNYIAPTLDFLIAAMADAQRCGRIKPIPIPHLKMIVLGSIMLFFSLNFDLQPDVDMEQLSNEHAQYVIDVLFNGILS